MSDYEYVNSPAFIGTLGRQTADRLDQIPPDEYGYIKRRFDPEDTNPNRPRGTVGVNGRTLTLTFHPVSEWEPKHSQGGVGPYGWLFVASEGSETIPVLRVRRPEHHSIIVHELPESLTGLCAAWIAGDPTFRRTDLVPFWLPAERSDEPGTEPHKPSDSIQPEEPVSSPDSIFDTVKRFRAKYTAPLSNAEMGELVNRIAWEHRADGWGLAKKNQGAHTLQPHTGIHISRDLLIHQATGETYDVLRDVEGDAEPTWNHIETGIMEWVAPVGDPLAEPAPPPVPEPPTGPLPTEPDPPFDPPDDSLPAEPTPDPSPPTEPTDDRERALALIERLIALIERLFG